MRFPFRILSVLLLASGSNSLFAQGILPSDRWPVQGTPRICGREIPQFILRENVSTQRANEGMVLLYAIPKGLFIPVSQDKHGVFYHAMNGLLENRGPDGVMLVPGGLHVSKATPNKIDVYFGDARKAGAALRQVYFGLRTDVLAKLQISHFAPRPDRATRKKTSR